jgi:hypothetical protein
VGSVAAAALAVAALKQVPNWVLLVPGILGLSSLLFAVYNCAGLVLLGREIPDDDPNGGLTTRKVAFTAGLAGIGLASALGRRTDNTESTLVAWFPTVIWILSALTLASALSRPRKNLEGGSDDPPQE